MHRLRENATPYRRRAIVFLYSAAAFWCFGCSEEPKQPPSAGSQASPRNSLLETVPEAIKGALATHPDCNLEGLDTKAFAIEPVKVKAGAQIRLSGWVIDSRLLAAPDAVFVRVETEDKQRTWYAPLALTVDRPDVVSARAATEAARRSGFDSMIDTGPLQPGTYRLQIAYKTKGEENGVCDNGRRIIVE